MRTPPNGKQNKPGTNQLDQQRENERTRMLRVSESAARTIRQDAHYTSADCPVCQPDGTGRICGPCRQSLRIGPMVQRENAVSVNVIDNEKTITADYDCPACGHVVETPGNVGATGVRVLPITRANGYLIIE